MADLGTREAADKLWAAVDAITKPTSRRLARDIDQETVEALQAALKAAQDPPRGRSCSVGAYRNARRALGAVAISHGTVSSLWEQAEIALTTGAESAGGHRSMLATRSPADLALMETMADIREAVALQIQGRGEKPKGTVPVQMRHLATMILPVPQHVEWWTMRFEQWKRVLETYLRAVEAEARPVRLRNAPCPECKAKSVIVNTDDGPVVAPPLMVDFRDGYIRAAQCTACAYAWWRGEDLFELAERLAYGDTPKQDPRAVVM